MNGNSNLVGQWYLRRDLHEIFQVTGYDERSYIQSHVFGQTY
jgi:hypothetical protein